MLRLAGGGRNDPRGRRLEEATRWHGGESKMVSFSSLAGGNKQVNKRDCDGDDDDDDDSCCLQ